MNVNSFFLNMKKENGEEKMKVPVRKSTILVTFVLLMLTAASAVNGLTLYLQSQNLGNDDSRVDTTNHLRRNLKTNSDTSSQGGITAAQSINISNQYLFLAVSAYDGTPELLYRVSDYKDLLYPSTTSFMSVLVDGVATKLSTADNVTRVDNSTIRVVYSSWTSLEIDIILEYHLINDFILFDTTVVNKDGVSHDVGIRWLIDTQLGANDGAVLYSETTGVVTNETDIPNPSFSTWKAFDQMPNPTFETISSLISPPERIVFGWWPNAYYSTWDYTPNPNQPFFTPGYTTSPQSDSCVIMWWSVRTIAAGDSYTWDFTYGLSAPSSDAFWKLTLNQYLSIIENALLDYLSQGMDSLASMLKVTAENVVSQGISSVLKIIGQSMLGAKDEILQGNLDSVINVFKENEEFIGSSWSTAAIQQLKMATGNLASTQLKQSVVDLVISMFTDVLTNYLNETYILEVVKQLYGYDDIVNQIRTAFSNVRATINNYAGTDPPFNLTDLLLILDSQATMLSKGITGDKGGVVTPLGNVFSLGGFQQLHALFEKVASVVDTMGTIEETLMWVNLATGLAGVFIAATGIPVAAAAFAAITGATKLASMAVETVKISGIAAKAAITLFSILQLGSYIYELSSVANDIASFVSDQFTNPIDFSKYSAAITDSQIPNIISVPFLGTPVASGTVTVANTGSVSSKIVISVSVLAPNGKVFHHYYDSATINPGQSHVFDLYYYGLPSDWLGLNPYYLLVEVFQNGIRMDSTLLSYRVGLGALGNVISETTQKIADFIIANGQSVYQSIGSYLNGGIVSLFTEGGMSDVDLRLWDGAPGTGELLVGLNYTTGLIVNVINADYSGPNLGTEYIRFNSSLSYNFTVELVGISLPASENISLYLSERDPLAPIIVVPDELYAEASLKIETTRTITLVLPITELGGDSDAFNITIQGQSLTHQSHALTITSITPSTISTLPAGTTTYVQITIEVPTTQVASGLYVGQVIVRNATDIIANTTVQLNLTLYQSLPEPPTTTTSPPTTSTTTTTPPLTTPSTTTTSEEPTNQTTAETSAPAATPSTITPGFSLASLLAFVLVLGMLPILSRRRKMSK